MDSLRRMVGDTSPLVITLSQHKSLLSITPQEPSTRSTGMMRTRLSMFSTGKLRCKFVEARFAGLVAGRYFTNHLKTFIP